MTLRLEAVVFDVADPPAVAAFWSDLLGREITDEAGGVLLPGNAQQVGLRFVAADLVPIGRPRLHLHLTSGSPEDQQRTVAKAVSLGGQHLDVGQTAADGHVVLIDPGGNELCVIEPDNGYLAGTGFLGEVTCDGGRAAGLFWHGALGWPIVWDIDEQLVIQSPAGGTKLAWDVWERPAVHPIASRSPQGFDVLASDLDGGVERLISLGARFVDQLPSGVELLDPGGASFTVRRQPPDGA